MSARLSLVVAIALLAAGCGGGSPDTSQTLPPVTAFATRPIVGCNLGLGVGDGAKVVQVLDGRPAHGVLEPNDVVYTFAGQRIDNAADLVRAVQSQTPGETVELEVERGGSRDLVTLDLTTGSVNDAGQPLIGVTVITDVDLVRPDDLGSTEAPAGEFVRSLELEGSMYALDPLAGEWHAFGVAAPEGWVGFGDDVWTLGGTEASPVLLAATTGRQLPLASGEWELQLPLADLGDSIIFLADRVSTDPLSTANREPALVAISGESAAITWVWIPGIVETADAQWVPVNAFASPNQNRLLAVVAVNDGRSLGSVVLDSTGAVITPWDPAAGGGPFEDLLPLGWFDDTRLTFFDPATGQTILIPVVGGTATVLNVLPEAGVESLWPVGDGLHVMAQSENQLSLIDEAGDTRPLAVECSTPRMGGIGFGT